MNVGKKVEFVVRGISPLLCHNPQMVDPEFELNRAIKKLTGKKKKTDEDLNEIGRLEWFGGLYTANIGGRGVVSQPTSKLRKCLINAARISKQGKQIERSIIMTGQDVPLIYDGSDKAVSVADEQERLFANKAFVSRLSVGVNGKRVMRVRPQFMPWAMIVTAVFITDAGLNFDDLVSVFNLAGQCEGIGDNRVNGYGKFIGTVREVTNGSKPIEETLEGVDRFLNKTERAVA